VYTCLIVIEHEVWSRQTNAVACSYWIWGDVEKDVGG
jgi:hypothetical protein